MVSSLGVLLIKLPGIFLYKSCVRMNQFLLAVYLEVESVSHRLGIYLPLYGTDKLFPQAIIPIYPSSCSTFSPLGRCAGPFPCGFMLRPLKSDVEHLFLCPLCIWIASVNCIFSTFYIVLLLQCLFCCCSAYKSFVSCMYCKYMLLSYGLPFHVNIFFRKSFILVTFIIFSFMVNVFCVLTISLPTPRVMKILCSSRLFCPSFGSVIRFA